MNNKTTLFAVNGTLMRGLDLNQNLLDVGGKFVRQDKTAAFYRLWTIDDKHPAMMRTSGQGVSVELEIWSIPYEGLGLVLENEPPGLSIGKVILMDGSVVLGVLGEAFLCEGQREISQYGGWRSYIKDVFDKNL